MRALLITAGLLLATTTSAFANQNCIKTAELAGTVFDLRVAETPIESVMSEVAGDNEAIQRMVTEIYDIANWRISGSGAFRGMFIKRWTEPCYKG